MLPFSPRMVVPAAKVVVPVPSKAMRLDAPVLPSTMVPPPETIFVPWNATTPLPLRLMVPPNVSPLMTRSMPPLVARSSVPLSVTPLKKLEPLANPTSAPVPVELIVPPVIVLPNWLTTLPLAMLMVPPVLLMLWFPDTPIFAVLAPPTLMVPVLVVLPLPTKFKPNASMVMVPALDRVKIDWPVLMVTTPVAPIVAASAAPGVAAGLPLPVAQASQLVRVAQLPAVVFHVQLAADAGIAAPTRAPPTKSCATSCAMAVLRATRRLCWAWRADMV